MILQWLVVEELNAGLPRKRRDANFADFFKLTFLCAVRLK